MEQINPRLRPERKITDITIMIDHICKHDKYCQVKKLLSKAHCSKDYVLVCPTAKYWEDHPAGICIEIKTGLERFMQRYPKWLGVGALMPKDLEILFQGRSADNSTNGK